MSNAVTLDLTGRTLRLTTAEEAQSVVDEIRAVSATVKTIKFSGSTVGPLAAEAIGAAIGECVSLQSADLNDLFTGRSVDEIKPAVSAFVGGLSSELLTEVDLSNNAFGPRAAVHLPPLLQKPSLRKLFLNNNGLGSGGAKIVSDALVEKETPPQLETLVIGRNRLETNGALALAPAIKVIAPTLREFKINSNGIQPEGMAAILNSLREASNLQVLELSDNNVLKAMDVLLEVLPLFPELRVLGLGDCFLDNKSVLRLVPVIDGLKNLVELNLSYSDIHDDVAQALASILRSKTGLKKLDLNGNVIKAAGLAAIRDVLASLSEENILGSMSDNEGDDDDEEEEDD